MEQFQRSTFLKMVDSVISISSSWGDVFIFCWHSSFLCWAPTFPASYLRWNESWRSSVRGSAEANHSPWQPDEILLDIWPWTMTTLYHWQWPFLIIVLGFTGFVRFEPCFHCSLSYGLSWSPSWVDILRKGNGCSMEGFSVGRASLTFWLKMICMEISPNSWKGVQLSWTVNDVHDCSYEGSMYSFNFIANLGNRLRYMFFSFFSTQIKPVEHSRVQVSARHRKVPTNVLTIL